MPTIKTIGVTALVVLGLFAVLDFFNKTSWLLMPVTTVRGHFSGNTDPTVAGINSPAQT